MAHDVERWGWTIANIFRQPDGALEFVLRWREIPRGVARSEWPITLLVTWENRFSTGDGFPVPGEQQAMSDFELRLGEAVERDALAVMSLSVTGQKKRELYFHTRDVDEFSKRLHEMPQEEARYPIELEMSRDPAWNRVAEVFARFGVESSPSWWGRLKSIFS